MKSKKYAIYGKKAFRDDDKNKKKVRDHCHYKGNFGGAVHSEFNLKYNVPKKNSNSIS